MAFVGAVGLHMTKRRMKVRGSMTNMLLFNMFFCWGGGVFSFRSLRFEALRNRALRAEKDARPIYTLKNFLDCC